MAEKMYIVTGKKPYSKNANMTTPWGNVSFNEDGVAEVSGDVANFLMNNPQYDVVEKKAKKKKKSSSTTTSDKKKVGKSKKNSKKDGSKTEPPAEEQPQDDDGVPGDVD